MLLRPLSDCSRPVRRYDSISPPSQFQSPFADWGQIAASQNQEITATIQKVADEFKVQPLEGVLSHQTKRFVVDGNNVVINKETIDQKVEDVTFEDWDAYTFDIVMSTGEGKARETEARTTIFKRAVDQRYTLKLKASRAVFTEINTRFPTMPFTLRSAFLSAFLFAPSA